MLERRVPSAQLGRQEILEPLGLRGLQVTLGQLDLLGLPEQPVWPVLLGLRAILALLGQPGQRVMLV